MAAKGGGSKSSREGWRKDPPDVRLSKFLSYNICRHGAQKEGLEVSEGGFVSVAAILALPSGRSFNEEDVRRVVSNCPKQRFLWKEQDGSLLIRANQGHSMQVKDLELVPIVNSADVPVVVHGTYRRVLEAIKLERKHELVYKQIKETPRDNTHDSGGSLSRMKRTHMHFAPGLPGEAGVISGMRSSCQVLVFIDMEKALKDGLKFYRSANDVILCPGNEDGFLLPEYFEKIVKL